MAALKKPSQSGQSTDDQSKRSDAKAAGRRLKAIKVRLKEIMQERQQLQAELSQLLGKKVEGISGEAAS